MDCDTQAKEGRSQRDIEPVQGLISTVMNGLKEHEQVVAELRRQLDHSLAAHQQQLMQELEHVMQQTAGQAYAPLPTSTKACAAASTASFSALATSRYAGQASRCVEPSVCLPDCKLDLQHLQAATAHAQDLQQQLDAAEAKLSVHRAAAALAKKRITDLEKLLQQQHTVHTTCPGQQQAHAAVVAHWENQNEGNQLLSQLEQTPAMSSDLLKSSSADFHLDNWLSLEHQGHLENAEGRMKEACRDDCCQLVAMTPGANSEQSSSSNTTSTHDADKSECWDLIPKVITSQEPRTHQCHSAQQDLLDQGHRCTDSSVVCAEQLTGVAPVPSASQQQIQHLQQQSSSLLDKLRLTLRDNTVLSYECMHLQKLLVQERLVGRDACRSVALKLACDVVMLTQQLEEVQVELDNERQQRELRDLLSADEAKEHGAASCENLTQHGEHDMLHSSQDSSGCVDEDRSADADVAIRNGAGVTAAECVAVHHDMMVETLGQHAAANQITVLRPTSDQYLHFGQHDTTQALLQELHQQMTTIQSAYQDMAWADSIASQLAAIDQAFGADYAAVSAKTQEPCQTAATTAAVPAVQLSNGDYSSLLPGDSMQAGVPSIRSPAVAKPQAYVTTPSGHVSMINDPSCQVLLPLDAADPRTPEMITGTWPPIMQGVISRASCAEYSASTATEYSQTAPVPAAALQAHAAGQLAVDAVAVDKRAIRKSSLMQMTRGHAALHENQQRLSSFSASSQRTSNVGHASSHQSSISPRESGPLVWHSNPLGTQELVAPTVQEASATLETLQAAAELLGTCRSQDMAAYPGGDVCAFATNEVIDQHGMMPIVNQPTSNHSRAAVGRVLSTAPQIRDNPVFSQHACHSSDEPSAGFLRGANTNMSAADSESTDIAVQLIDAMQQAAAEVLGRQPAAEAKDIRSSKQVIQESQELSNQQEDMSLLDLKGLATEAVHASDAQEVWSWGKQNAALHKLKQRVAAQRLQMQQLHFQLTVHPHFVQRDDEGPCS